MTAEVVRFDRGWLRIRDTCAASWGGCALLRMSPFRPSCAILVRLRG